MFETLLPTLLAVSRTCSTTRLITLRAAGDLRAAETPAAAAAAAAPAAAVTTAARFTDFFFTARLTAATFTARLTARTFTTFLTALFVRLTALRAERFATLFVRRTARRAGPFLDAAFFEDFFADFLELFFADDFFLAAIRFLLSKAEMMAVALLGRVNG
jgi:hypothetical protein